MKILQFHAIHLVSWFFLGRVQPVGWKAPVNVHSAVMVETVGENKTLHIRWARRRNRPNGSIIVRQCTGAFGSVLLVFGIYIFLIGDPDVFVIGILGGYEGLRVLVYIFRDAIQRPHGGGWPRGSSQERGPPVHCRRPWGQSAPPLLRLGCAVGAHVQARVQHHVPLLAV